MNVVSDMSQAFVYGLQIEVRVRGTTTTIALRGEWDLAGQPGIRRAIGDVLADPPERLVLDLSGLCFMDAGGLRSTVELARRAAAMNVSLSIVPGPRAVQRIFDLCQVSGLPWDER